MIVLGRPGLRERFILGEHRYCDNVFYDLFCSSLRMRWPFSFQECYAQNAETGMLSISPTFSQCISDIRNWTMGPDIFARFPEFYGDLPALYENPRPISNVRQLQLGVLPSKVGENSTNECEDGGKVMKEFSTLFDFGSSILLPNEDTSVNSDLLDLMFNTIEN